MHHCQYSQWPDLSQRCAVYDLVAAVCVGQIGNLPVPAVMPQHLNPALASQPCFLFTPVGGLLGPIALLMVEPDL
jgi:hypothetical protein